MTAFWNTERQNQGQIVTEMYPQVRNAAEGTEGIAKGLRLVYDGCDGEWTLYNDPGLKTVLASGNHLTGARKPTVEQAVAIRNLMKK